MAFYLRKFGHSFRIFPVTKSFCYSTRTNEGDTLKKGSDGTYSKTVGKKLQEESLSALPLPLAPLAASSLVPLSVRDMSLVLLPQLQSSVLALRQSTEAEEDVLDIFLDVAKAVPYTCDDILPSCLDLPKDVASTRRDSLKSQSFNIGGSSSPFFSEQMNRRKQEQDQEESVSAAGSNSNTKRRSNSYDYNGLYGLVSSVSPLSLRREADKWAFSEIIDDVEGDERRRSRDTNTNTNNVNNNNTDDECDMKTTVMMSESDMPLLPDDGVLFCSSGTGGGDKSSNKSKSKDGPSLEQLHDIKERLEKSIEVMFTNRYDYHMLHKNVVFENQLFGESSSKVGQTAYALELLRMRLRIHARFSSTSVEVLNTTVHQDKGMVRVHWRLKGLPQTELLKFWRVFSAREEISKDDYLWFEAFSYFRIGKDGLVHNHRIDRMLPGSEQPDGLTQKLGKLLNPKPLVS